MSSVCARVDLNVDCGEGFGPWRMGDDAGVLPWVSSASIACGFHAGDPDWMLRTVDLCLQHGVVIGAHPGHRDLAGFGRRALPIGAAQLEAETLYQLGALQAIVRRRGGRLAQVKPHGALYHQLDQDTELADAFMRAVHSIDPALVVLGPVGGALQRQALQCGLRTLREGYIERGYGADGRLLPRDQPGAVLHEQRAMIGQALDLVLRGGVQAACGTWLPLPVDSLCIHGDRPDAPAVAQAVHQALSAAGVRIAAVDADATG